MQGSLKSKVQQNTPDLSVSGPDKNILKIWKKSIKEIFQITSVQKNDFFFNIMSPPGDGALRDRTGIYQYYVDMISHISPFAFRPNLLESYGCGARSVVRQPLKSWETM